MILSTQAEYVALNLATRHHMYFTDKTELLKKNQEGYNIYYILNDFDRGRSLGELIGFKFIGVDLDNKQLIPEQIVEKCKVELGFLPCKINETFKGYHILFQLEESLYPLHDEKYLELYDYINKILGGDPAMKDITSIFKLPGFIDNKEGRNYLITEVYSHKNFILEKHLEELSIEVLLDTKRIERYNKKLERKRRNKLLLESLDPYTFIEKINEAPEVFQGCHIKISPEGAIDNTSGLKIFWDGEKNTIKDFTQKKRYGNYNFFFNYVLKEKMELNLNEREIIQRRIFDWFREKFGIVFNKNLNEEPIVDSFLLYNLENWSIDQPIKQDLVTDVESLEAMEQFNAELLRLGGSDFLHRLAASINHHALNTQQNLRDSIIISQDDFLSILGWYPDYENKKKLRNGLFRLSSLIAYKDGTIVDGVFAGGAQRDFIRLFDLSLIQDPGKKLHFKIKVNFSSIKKVWLDPKLLQGKNSLFYSRVKEICTRYGNYNDNLAKVLELSGRTSEKSLRNLLKEYKEKKQIKNFEIKKERVTINI